MLVPQHMNQARLFCQRQHLFGFSQVFGKGFFAQHMFACGKGRAHNFKMAVGWGSYADKVNAGQGERFLHRCHCQRNVGKSGAFPGFFGVATDNGLDVKARGLECNGVDGQPYAGTKDHDAGCLFAHLQVAPVCTVPVVQ